MKFFGLGAATRRASRCCSKDTIITLIEESSLPTPAQRFFGRIVSYIPELDFISIHYAYFILTIMLTSLIFWGSSTPEQSLAYIDCLFLITSAMTETGLNTINLSTLNSWQQVILFLLMILGSFMFISVFVVWVRKQTFESRFADIVEAYKLEKLTGRRRARSGGFITRPAALSRRSISQDAPGPADENHNHRSGLDELPKPSGRFQVSESSAGPHSMASSNGGRESISIYRHMPGRFDGARDDSPKTKLWHNNVHFEASLTESGPGEHFAPPIRDVLDKAILGRNGSLHVLAQEDRELLGGAEYRALRLFSLLVPAYYIILQLVGCLSTALYIGFRHSDIVYDNGQNPWWLGIFLGVSAFNNCGMSLLDAGMAPFQQSYYVLLTLAAMILLGNVAYPILLRLIIWTAYKLIPKHGRWQLQSETIRFCLDYPRRVYVSMFPTAHTWWLFIVLIALTGIDWLGLELLNLKNEVLNVIPSGYREADDFFQSVSIRTAGFGVYSVATLAIGNQVLLLIMMYISAYPFAITLRSSNVYEERSLGIFETSRVAVYEEKGRKLSASSNIRRTRTGRMYFLRQQLSHQLSHDMWWLAVAIMAIVCIETESYNRDPKTFATFNIIFEVVSAYGPVGLSTGLADAPYSLSGGFHIASKLIICAVMLRGRHRGLPVSIDRAILLPGEKNDLKENEQWKMHEDMEGVRRWSAQSVSNQVQSGGASRSSG